MVSINNIKRFISNDFENAMLSARIKDNKLELSLLLKEETEIKYDTISCYSNDLKKLRNDSTKFCNYLLDIYLQNNVVIGINYFYEKPHHTNKNYFEIITINGTLTLAFSKEIQINDLLPNFVNRLEFAKHEGIISYLEELKNIPIQHGYVKDRIDLVVCDKLRTGLMVYNSQEFMASGKYSNSIHYNFRYKVLKIIKDGKEIVPDYEKKFLVILVKKILEITNGQFDFEYVIKNIEHINYRLENGYGYFNRNILNLGNLEADYYSGYKNSKESLQIMKDILIQLGPYFKKNKNEGNKQLILGGYYGINNGKIS